MHHKAFVILKSTFKTLKYINDYTNGKKKTKAEVEATIIH